MTENSPRKPAGNSPAGTRLVIAPREAEISEATALADLLRG
jgi:hypothetical protein